MTSYRIEGAAVLGGEPATLHLVDGLVADSPRCTAVEQVANGVSTRMAVLYLLLGGSEPAFSTARTEESK